MPVADQREGQKQERNQQQAGRFRGVHSVVVLVRGIVLELRGGHVDIVDP